MIPCEKGLWVSPWLHCHNGSSSSRVNPHPSVNCLRSGPLYAGKTCSLSDHKKGKLRCSSDIKWIPLIIMIVTHELMNSNLLWTEKEDLAMYFWELPRTVLSIKYQVIMLLTICELFFLVSTARQLGYLQFSYQLHSNQSLCNHCYHKSCFQHPWWV